MPHIPHPDLYDAQRWAEEAAADADAELTSRRRLDDEADAAAQAAAHADADAAYARLDEADVIDTDLF